MNGQVESAYRAKSSTAGGIERRKSHSLAKEDVKKLMLGWVHYERSKTDCCLAEAYSRRR